MAPVTAISNIGLRAALTKHNAPAVVYPIKRSRSQWWFSWASWAGGLLLMLLWYLNTMRLDWRIGLGCVAVLVSAWNLHTVWQNDIAGHLIWDGSCWRWECITALIVSDELKLSVVADLQRLLVVVLDDNTGNRFWLCSERGAFPERWLDFRRAVYSASRMADGQAGIDHVSN